MELDEIDKINSFRDVIQYIFLNYSNDYKTYDKKIKGDPEKTNILEKYKKNLFDSMRNSLSKIESLLNDIEYDIGVGQGLLTYNPYILFKINNSEYDITPQNGYYLVYLFSRDMKKVYLSINQGAGKSNLSKGDIKIISEKLQHFFFKNINGNNGFTIKNIDIGAQTDTTKKYECAHIFGKKYLAEELATEDILIQDLIYAIKIYKAFAKIIYENNKDALVINPTILDGSYFKKNPKCSERLTVELNKIEGVCTNMAKNIILYGPPGTGKTFNVINKALEIINPKKYNEIIESNYDRKKILDEFNKLLGIGQISFCTFHQSYSYEDFVEGLRCDEQGRFMPRDGIFKQICNTALLKSENKLIKYDFDVNKINFHKMSLGDTSDGDDSIFDYCINNGCVALGWGEDIDYSKCKSLEDIRVEFLKVKTNADSNDFNIAAINRFINNIKKDDIIIISYGNYKARAIAKVVGDYEYRPNSEIGFSHFRKVEWIYKSEKIEVSRILQDKAFSQQAIYKFNKNDLNIDSIKELISSKEINDEEKKYVLIIDEINRGNISKIFGELITLIEEDKRLGCTNEIKITLPYSNEKLGVPSNLYIIGTMNTADRSIALLDTALRRRFDFIEYMPNAELLPDDIDGINLRKFLEELNVRIEFLFDKDHTIGHAYFIKEKLTFDGIVEIMKKKIIPLLQEYFYGDFEKIELILGGAGKNDDDNYFLSKKEVNANKLFKKNNMSNDYPSQYKYKLVEKPSKAAFINLYDDSKKTEV